MTQIPTLVTDRVDPRAALRFINDEAVARNVCSTSQACLLRLTEGDFSVFEDLRAVKRVKSMTYHVPHPE